MAKQLHKRFTTSQIIALLEKHQSKEIELSYILNILGISRRRFFNILKSYREDKDNFSIDYKRNNSNNKIGKDIEKNILTELKIEKDLIDAEDNTIRNYNYSYLRDILKEKYKNKVSLTTLIDRAKKGGFYINRPKSKAHDREVVTNYAGELIQHDSSHHKWSPYAESKWYLITSIDDCSRYLLYYNLVEAETSWAHIMSLEDVAVLYGLPYSYYFDCHSIFRFVQGRDSLWRKHYKVTDDVDPQVKKILLELGIKVRYALSPQAKAYGKIGGTTRDGLKMANGKSKDHRPDLKQLLFSLTISSDGAVPVHYKTYPGNRTDDTTHIETWDAVRNIAGTGDFIYVADCKVCTQKQLSYIAANGGRVITVMPDTWKESKSFKDSLRTKKIPKKVILRKTAADGLFEYEYFSLFEGEYVTLKNEYRIYWYCSSEKKRLDRARRQKRMQKADSQLAFISSKLNRAKLKTKSKIKERIEGTLKKEVAQFFTITIYEKHKYIKKQIGRGRPGPGTKYQIHKSTSYSLLWEPDKKRLKQEENVDGIFPLLTTDRSFGPKEVLSSYKYQPRLEKRFNQFKSVHEAAPLLFKKIERVEAIMFLFFMALMVQGIIERKVRLAMKEKNIKSLPIYPEYRSSFYPTTSKIFYNFDSIFSYKILKDDKVVKEFKDSLSSAQKTILDLLDIDENEYWG